MLELAATAIGSSVEAPRGNLKVTAPVWFANPRIVDVMARYREKYPDVVLDLRFTNRKVDLAAEGYDRSEEHTSELQSLMRISYAVFCLKKKKKHFNEKKIINI